LGGCELLPTSPVVFDVVLPKSGRDLSGESFATDCGLLLPETPETSRAADRVLLPIGMRLLADVSLSLPKYALKVIGVTTIPFSDSIDAISDTVYPLFNMTSI
jgi:hypothetical protein